MLKRIFKRICDVWVQRQEEAIVEEYELLKAVWQEEYSQPIVQVKPSITWAEFKARNALVDRYLNRTRVA